MEQTVARAGSSPGPTDSHSSERDISRSGSESSPVKDTDNLIDCETEPAVGDKSECTDTGTVDEVGEKDREENQLESRSRSTSIIQEETETSDSCLLNDAVTNHEKSCGDTFDATIAICSIFNTTEQETSGEKLAEHRNADKDTSGEFLITDLDSFSSDMKEVKVNSIEISNQSSSKIDVSYSNSMSPHSPQIILLDLQSQDEYVSDILSKGAERKRIKEEVDEFLSTNTDQIHTSSSDHLCFVDESMKNISDDESVLFRNNDGLGSPEYEYVRGKKCHSDLRNSPIFFQDLNYDYEQIPSKSLDRIENTKTDCDTIFYDPDYSQNQDETRTDKFYISSKMSTHVNSDSDLHGHDISINDSGFFDTSYISAEKNFFTGRTQDLPVQMSNQIIGISKSNLNGQFLNSIGSVHGESILSNSFKQSHYVNPHESHLVTEAVSPTTPFGFANNVSPSYMNTLIHKQPLMDYGTSYPQGLPSYTELTESCSLSAYPDWNSWSNVANQELNVGSIPSSPYINSHLSQPKYIWHGDCNKIENAEMHHDCMKPAATDNDSEETEDADEFDDVPLFFNASSFVTGYERQWMAHPNSCYSDGTPGSQFGSENLTPPPSASNTPSDTSSLYSPTDLSTMSSTCSKTPCEKMNSSLMPYEFVPGPKLPYPSMADMMRGTRSNSTKSSGMTVKRILADAIPQGGRFRKTQIQSDTISTSTSKSGRYKKKWMADSKRREPDHINDLCINLDGFEEPEQNHGPRRHNEPLNQQAIDIMSQWYEEHLDNPYPTKTDKLKMATEGGITVTQVKSWFANKRNRTNNTKPKVQKRAMEEKLKELFKDITCNRSIPLAENSHIIKQLSGIIQTCHSNKME